MRYQAVPMDSPVCTEVTNPLDKTQWTWRLFDMKSWNVLGKVVAAFTGEEAEQTCKLVAELLNAHEARAFVESIP